MSAFTLNRRTLLKSAAIGSLGLTTGLLTRRAAFAADLTIGIIYVGSRDDYGWNQAHAVAAKALAEVPGVKVVEEENVPETIAVAKTMESMIELDGANLIFATSFGYYSPFMVDAAKKYPDVQFRHAAPLWKDRRSEERRLAISAISTRLTTSTASPPAFRPSRTSSASSPPSRSPRCSRTSIRSRSAPASVNPDATVQVIFTGEWSMPVREAEATNALIDAGCDVITCHVDSPKTVIQNAEAKGVKTCGHNASQADLAPKGFITGAEYKWETIYKQYADTLAKGGELPNFLSGGYDLDFVQNTPYGAGATPEAIEAADAAKVEMRAKKAGLCRPAQGQYRQGSHPGRHIACALRSVDRPDQLPRRGRHRLDHLIGPGGQACPAASRKRRSRPRPGRRCTRPAPPHPSPLSPRESSRWPIPSSRTPPSGRLGRASPTSLDRMRRSSEYVLIPLFALVVGGAALLDLPAGARPVAGDVLLAALARRLRHRVLMAEHAGARRAADPHGALRRDPGAARPRHHRRRGRAGARRLRGGRRRRFRCVNAGAPNFVVLPVMLVCGDR